jgi:hypothetical protein
VPRSNCPENRDVERGGTPGARRQRLTLLFEAMVILLCREMPMTTVVDTLGSLTPGSGAYGCLHRSGPRQKFLGEGATNPG